VAAATLADAWNAARQQQLIQAEVAEKGRKAKIKVKLEHEGGEGHDLRDGEPPALTGAHEAARAGLDAERAEAARRTIAGLEAEPGPGTFGEPAAPGGASQFDRGYIDAGHGAASAQSQGPNVSPLQHAQPGLLRPLEHVAWDAVPTVAGHGGPVTDAMRVHQGRAGLPLNTAGGDL